MVFYLAVTLESPLCFYNNRRGKHTHQATLFSIQIYFCNNLCIENFAFPLYLPFDLSSLFLYHRYIKYEFDVVEIFHTIK
jgi:hypothetical protein